MIAAGSWLGEIRIWDVSSGEFQLAQTVQGSLFAQPQYPTTNIVALKFSFDSSQLYSVGGNGIFTRWDANIGEVLETLRLLGAPIYAAAFSPDGTQLVYGSQRGAVKFICIPSSVPTQTPASR